MHYLSLSVWLVVGLLLSTGRLWAQCPPRPTGALTGDLRTSSLYGCVPHRVTATTSQTAAVNVRYIYEYDKNRPMPTVTTGQHTYVKPGLYYLVQYYEVLGEPITSCAQVYVYDTIPPRVEVASCGTRISLTISDPLVAPLNYSFFVVSWGDGKQDTVQARQPRRDHTYATTDPRRIRVQGIHQYGSCGGTTALTFTPNQPATVQAVEPVQPGVARVQIQNPGGLSLRVQGRVGNGAFGVGVGVPAGVSPSVDVSADSTQTTCYRVVPDGSCPGYSPSPEVCFRPPPLPPKPPAVATLYLPNAFSPNNDGLNDTFGPVGEVATGPYRLTIFDRWGQVVFSTTDARQVWDGLTNGNLSPVGMYTYQLETGSVGGLVYRRSGHIQLMR